MNLEKTEFQGELGNFRLLFELQLLKFILIQTEPHRTEDMRTLAGLGHKNLKRCARHLLGAYRCPFDKELMYNDMNMEVQPFNEHWTENKSLRTGLQINSFVTNGNSITLGGAGRIKRGATCLKT